MVACFVCVQLIADGQYFYLEQTRILKLVGWDQRNYQRGGD